MFQIGLLDAIRASCQSRKSGKGAHVRRFVTPLNFVQQIAVSSEHQHIKTFKNNSMHAGRMYLHSMNKR